MVGARSQGSLGMEIEDRRSTDGKNRALIIKEWGGGDMIQGGGNLALVYLVGAESQKNRVGEPVMNQV